MTGLPDAGARLLDREAPRWLPGPHLQTLFPFLVPVPPLPVPSRQVTAAVGDGSAVRVEVERPPGERRGTLLLVHGVGGCSDSWYMRRTALQALSRGWVVARMNCRNCGGTERLGSSLYNAAQSDDVGAVLRRLGETGCPAPFGLIGFSLGGNLALRYAGTAVEACLASAVAALNPPVDLDRCSSELERPGNVVYRRYFLKKLCRLIDAVRSVREVPGPPAHWWRIPTIREFDRLFVAPAGGFASAEHYYAEASAGPYLASIARPTLILSSLNDPVVPADTLVRHHGTNPRLCFVHPARGGHLGYWSRRAPRFAGAALALAFLERELAIPGARDARVHAVAATDS